jgi:hypothetical protein
MFQHTGTAILLLAGAAALAAGCSGKNKVEDYTPAAERGRQALEAALSHLKAGNPPGAVPGTTPVVHLVDTRWKAGQKLQSFEVVGEEGQASEGAARFFKVRLILAKGSPQEVRYAVLGIDPLWVYREEDYNSLSGVAK